MILTLTLSLCIFVLIIISIIFFPKLKVDKVNLSTYWIIALVGALCLIVSSCVSLDDVISILFDERSINPIQILCLFFSMTFISIFLEKAGFFEFLASWAAKKAKNNQVVLFVVLYCLTAVLTIFTSNDIVILTFTPFICYFAKKSKINPLPYLIGEFAAANTWSMMLIIGNPTNIYLGLSKGIAFFEYFKVMSLPTLIAGVIEFLIILLLFKKELKKPMEVSSEVVALKDKCDAIVGLVHLLVCLVLLVLSNLINFPMWLISVCIASSLFIYFIISSVCKRNFANKGKAIGNLFLGN